MPGSCYFSKETGGVNKSFLLFLVSQCISCFGDAFQLVAATTLIVKITGTGLSAGFAIICTPIASLLLSAYAGSLGDRFREKYVLVLIDLLRAVVVALFVFYQNLPAVYLLTLLLTSFDIFYSPPRKKILSGLLEDHQIMAGNSLLTGASGVSFLLGPVLAGILVDACGVEKAFLVNSLSFIVSAAIIAFIKPQESNGKYKYVKSPLAAKGANTIGEGLRYLKTRNSVREMIFTLTIVCMGMASMNVAFYPFAFDTLRVTSKGWGVMMSIFYGTNLIAMFIQILFERKIRANQMPAAYASLICVALVWLGYGVSDSLLAVLLLIFIEGTAEAVCGIILTSRMQVSTQKNYIARVMGINDFVNNAGKLLTIGATYLFIHFFSCRPVFIINAVVTAAFCIYKLLSTLPVKPAARRFI